MHVVSDDVTRQHELRCHLVELHQFACHDRIILAVHCARLQRGVEFGVGDRGRIGAERFTEELPEFTGRHAQLDAGHVGGRLDRLVRLQVDAAASRNKPGVMIWMPSWSLAILMNSRPTSLLNVLFMWSASRKR